MAEDERIGSAHGDDGSDISLMPLPSDLSCDAVPTFPQYSDKKVAEILESQLCSDTRSQACSKLTDNSLSMLKTNVSNQGQSCHKVMHEELENLAPESQAVDLISEAYEGSRCVNPVKDIEYLPEGSVLSNQQQERIVKNNNSSNNLVTFFDQKAKAREPCHEEAPAFTGLCMEKDDEKLCMGPPLMLSCTKTDRGVLRDIINHKDTLNSKIKSVDVRGIPINMQAGDKNVQQTDITNKENNVGLFLSELAAKHGSTGSKISVFDSDLLHVSKEGDFQKLESKNVALEKQLDEKMKPCMPFCNLNMVDTAPPVDNIQHMKTNIQVNDKISKLNSVELNVNIENGFHSPARQYVINEKQIHHPVVDGCALFHEVDVKESSPSYDDVIPAKQENQVDKAVNHAGSLNKPTSIAVQEYLAENIKEPFLVCPLRTGTVERTIAAQADLKMKQALQSKANLEVMYRQDQSIHLKPVKAKDNYIIVNEKGYKVQTLLGRGGSSQVFKVSWN
jgi:hypothetical protein